MAGGVRTPSSQITLRRMQVDRTGGAGAREDASERAARGRGSPTGGRTLPPAETTARRCISARPHAARIPAPATTIDLIHTPIVIVPSPLRERLVLSARQCQLPAPPAAAGRPGPGHLLFGADADPGGRKGRPAGKRKAEKRHGQKREATGGYPTGLPESRALVPARCCCRWWWWCRADGFDS